ncbi:MAG: sulfatase-like hydrolase/transferase, partial [Planctomycetota bacterium]
MERRRFFRSVGAGALGFAASSLARRTLAAEGQAVRPNLVFVLIDDLGWRDLGCYGSTYYQTPNVDRLAEQGMRFTDAYAACPVCSPTR